MSDDDLSPDEIEHKESEQKRRALTAERKAFAAIDGPKAWAEHLANADAVEAKTKKLRAQRLAKEAEIKEASASKGTKRKVSTPDHHAAESD